MGDNLAIDVKAVRKTYKGRVHALCGVDMQARQGEIFGLLGPNGAGKSTLVKIMLSVVRPTHVAGTVLGAPVGDKKALRKIGYLPEKHRFPEYLNGRQAIEFAGEMCGVDRATRRRRSDELLEMVGMKDWANRLMGTYSKGMQQRIGLAAAMVNDPDLVILDEPTDGVDPAGRRDIRDILIKIRSRGASVFLNSHLLSELEMVCDRVAIMVQGNVAAHGTIDELTADSRRYEFVVEGKPPEWCAEADLKVPPPYSKVSTSLLVATTSEASEIQGILDRLRADKRTVVSVNAVRESLEDLFMRYVTDPGTGKTKLPGAKQPSKGGDS